jgi:hypothetical protein
LTGEFFGNFVGGSATGAVQNEIKNLFRVNIKKEIRSYGRKKSYNHQLELPCEIGSNVCLILEFLLWTVGGKLPGSVG